MPLANKVLYEFGRFRFDPADHSLSSGGRTVSLTPKILEILLVLVQNGNRLTTKEELMQRVWPDSFVEEANLTVNISALRKLLGATPDGQQYIETLPKRGYRFVAPVRELRDPEPGAGPSESPDSAGAPARSPEDSPSPAPLREKTAAAGPRRYLKVLAIALLAVLILAIAYFTHRLRIVPAKSVPQARRLAVLPFQNLRGAPGDDFLSFSLADAVITKLGYVSSLRVRPSYAVRKYTSQNADIPKIASELNADTLLTGTFLHEGKTLRIAYQLVDVKSTEILWKGGFDLEYDKLLTVQDRVSQQVVRGLELTLSPTERERLEVEAARDPKAYEYYLHGVDLYSRGDYTTAIGLLEKSAELDPNYALTWAHLGRSYTADASFRLGGEKQYKKAQAAFERALALEPQQIEARVYLANMFSDTGKVEQAVPLLRAALQTNPNHAEVHWELGYAYRFAGMLEQSAAECERARQLDPGVKLGSSVLNAYLYLGQYDRFLQSLPARDDLPLVVFYRGLGEYYKGNRQQAAEHFDRAFALDPSLLQSQIGKAMSFAISQDRPKGVKMLRSVEQRTIARGVGDPEAIYKLAQADALLGEKTASLRLLAYSVDTGFFPYPYLVNDSVLDSLKSTREFSAILDKARQRHEAFKTAFF
ncbi:MAG TPA: winged helix-turn-helix domain-containing protein [Candidatus Saccharimonadales bacterium]|nr:winged helix-turn-helix domain-containing protein [Candidatus Saccharimonadales bacterium]